MLLLTIPSISAMWRRSLSVKTRRYASLPFEHVTRSGGVGRSNGLWWAQSWVAACIVILGSRDLVVRGRCVVESVDE